jgi:hypothetical protein
MKLAKSYAEYGQAKKGGDQCQECRWFRMPSSCELVEGSISPTGWCRFFTEGKESVPAWVKARARA